MSVTEPSSPCRRTPVAFPNRAGLRLFGVLNEPSQPAGSDLGFILLSPGVKMRVGPERLYLRIADLLVRLGIPVFRFDCHGLGDSEGSLPEDQLREVYGQIEVGRFVDDTLDAMDWMQQHTRTRRFVLAGLCGGAITGLLAGARDPRVVGLHALGITPLIASATADPSKYMTSGQLDAIGGTYLRKLADPDAWLRFLTLRTDYRLLWRAVSRKLIARRPGPAAQATAPRAVDDNASPLFPPAFFAMLRSQRPMLLIFGGSDRLGWEFEEKFVARHRPQLASLPATYAVHHIPHANHVLSFAEWQEEMIEVSERWLRSNFRHDVERD